MPAAPPVDRDQPSFLRFPIQNDRTGFKPVSLPVILVVPGRRNENGTALAGSQVFDVKYFVAKAPDPAKVAGPFNTEKLIPQLSQFVVNINSLQLLDVLIDVPNQAYFDVSGNEKSWSDEPAEGDYFEYTLIRGGTRSQVPYYPDADYYDLSLYTIDVEDLPRPKRYVFAWQASYNRRIVRSPSLSSTEGLFCVDEDNIGVAQYGILINHPGEVHHAMFRKTPPFYFDESQNNFQLSNDQVLEFYRPFADMLQDIFDEQTFLNGINHIDRVPAQLIPYLAYLIGWDLPNFPGVTDTVRRSILRHAVRLQRLKGSKRAIVELFEIFGFSIEIINLWYSTDGTRLIAPEELLPEVIQGQQIESETVCQIEPLTADYDTPGFGEFEVPLVYRAIDDITISAYLVQDGPTRNALNDLVEELTDDPTALEESCIRTASGNIIPQALLDRLPEDDPTVLATAEVFVDYRSGMGESTVSSTTIPIINELGITYDRERNLASVTFDHHLDFEGDESGAKLFIFATYPRTKITVPDTLKNLRSNRFDVRILLAGGDPPSPELFEFLMNFVFKLKAFHSLLRKIVFTLNILEVYNVQDLCFGEGSQLQVPPPIEPEEITAEECDVRSITEGYKQEDLDLRESIFDALLEEFQAWKALDNTNRTDASLNHFLNLPVEGPDGDVCQYTHLGQNRVESEPDEDRDHNPDERPKLCDERPPLPDNCFTGRVKDELDVVPQMLLNEIVRCKPCALGMGSGFYWLYPQTEQSLMRDGFGTYKGQNGTSFLGTKIRRYNKPFPYSLHYTNRPYLHDSQLQTDRLLAYRKPSLEIQKDNLAFPSHRFPTMSNMVDDFTHPEWQAKPWDDEDEDLNAQLITRSDGDEELVFDEADLVYEGNGLEPDISSLGTHDNRDFLVTHSVYLTAEEGHPSVTLDDRVVLTQEDTITLDSSQPFGPIFRSYNEECNQDYISGYPAETGRFDADPADYGFDRGDSLSEALADGLGLPVRGETDGLTDFTALFMCGSQILVEESDPDYGHYTPYRLDCECSRFGCSTGFTGTLTGLATASELTAATCPDAVMNVDQCHISQFQRPDGTLDFNCDQLLLQPTVRLSETLGICSTRLDGSIPNLLCVLDNGQPPEDLGILPEGRIYWKDDYGVIYESSWVFQDGILDIMMVTKSPIIWGEPETGFIRGNRVFRKGLITSMRQIIRVEDDGSYTIRGEGGNQEIGYFQSNVVCGDQPFVDNFCFHLDCMVTDELDTRVVCGPRWVSCEDDEVQWPMLVTDSSGAVVSAEVPEEIQPFGWISVWDNDEADEITGVCITDHGTEPVVEVSFEGEGGIIPAYDIGSGVWPTMMPHYAFESELEVDLDRRIVEFVSIEFKGLKHTFSGDLHAVLYGPTPEGRPGLADPLFTCPGVTVFHRPGSVSGSFGNFGNFMEGDFKFVESGAAELPHFSDIPPGTYRRDPGDWPGGLVPIGSFDNFVNVNTRGTWKLVIYDWELGDVGSLDSWVISLRVVCA